MMPDHVHMLVAIPPKDRRVHVHGISEGEKFAHDL